jgi:PPE-repeat protein
MVAAATPYVAWTTATAAQALQAANQARAVAAAYETAFAATVPPAAVAANRIQFATLIATNFFGQNTPAIAATEAAYAEMWAQDAAAMYGYAGSASPAAELTPFTQPPPTTNPVGQTSQSAAVTQAAGTAAESHLNPIQAISAVPQQVHTLSTAGTTGTSGPDSSALLTGVSDFNTITGPGGGFASATARTAGVVGDFVNEVNLYGIQSGAAAPPPPPPAPTGTVGVSSPMLVSVGKAAPVGNLSTPQAWAATATKMASPATPPLQLPGTDVRAVPAAAAEPAANPAGGAPPASVGPMQGMAERHGGSPVFRMKDRRFRMPRPAAGG